MSLPFQLVMADQESSEHLNPVWVVERAFPHVSAEAKKVYRQMHEQFPLPFTPTSTSQLRCVAELEYYGLVQCVDSPGFRACIIRALPKLEQQRALYLATGDDPAGFVDYLTTAAPELLDDLADLELRVSAWKGLIPITRRLEKKLDSVSRGQVAAKGVATASSRRVKR